LSAGEESYNTRNIAEFRASGGTVGSFGDAPLLLLTTIGAKTGKSRTSPMMYLADERDPDLVYVFASNAGGDDDPAWFRNLAAHPAGVTVEIGRETLTADAEVLPEPARSEIYAIQAARYPGFAKYESMTARRIPVAALTLHRTPR
jgi:deazaflavin-dependent oxidoreductase (nitroreductase family)